MLIACDSKQNENKLREICQYPFSKCLKESYTLFHLSSKLGHGHIDICFVFLDLKLFMNMVFN